MEYYAAVQKKKAALYESICNKSPNAVLSKAARCRRAYRRSYPSCKIFVLVKTSCWRIHKKRTTKAAFGKGNWVSGDQEWKEDFLFILPSFSSFESCTCVIYSKINKRRMKKLLCH